MGVNNPMTGKITHVKNTMTVQTLQWKNWKQNMKMPMTEETILG